MRPVGAGLPVGYKRVEYLESTGTQWIDTGYVPDNESGILLDQEKLSTGDFIPMGCRSAPLSGTRFYALRSSYAGDTRMDTGYGWNTWTPLNTIRGRQKTKLNYLNSRKVEGGGETQGLPSLIFEPNQPIYMFSASIGGTADLYWTGRIYEAAISQGESIVMSFVPCLDPEGAPCMFDLVSRKPFYNSATTGPDFLYG